MKKTLFWLLTISLLGIPSVNSATSTSARILTKFNIEKVASCATADLQYICMKDENSNLTVMAMDVKNMYAKTLKVIFKPGTIKGPDAAPGWIGIASEPQMPKYGNYVSFIGISGGRKFLSSVDVEGKTMKTAMIPDTSFEGVKTIWDVLWFRLNYNGTKFFCVVRGTVVEKGKKGSCFALVVENTDGTEPYFIYRPRWTGTKFEFVKDTPGTLIAPVGFSRDTMRVFFKAEIGASRKHGIYSCNYDGSDTKLVMTATGQFQQTVKSTYAWAADMVTDNGKYLVLNDNGLGHKGAVSIDSGSGAVLARLPYKMMATSCDSQYAFFSNSAGFGIEFIIGGEPQVLVTPKDPGYPALGKLNSRGNPDEPPISPTTCSPFGILGRSETDVRGKGQLYFTEILSPPVPPSPRLVLEPPLIDLGIVSDTITVPLGIRNPGQTAISGTAVIDNGGECSVFSFDGKKERKFSEIGDLPITVNPKCLQPGQTVESTIKVASTGGNASTPIVVTMDNPEVVLCKVGLGRAQYWVGTKENVFKVEPYIDGGTSMVPISLVTAAIPCDYSWSSEDHVATIEYQDSRIELTADSTTYLLDDTEKELPKAPTFKEDSLCIPVALLKDAFGCKVGFFKKTMTLTIEFPKPIWGRESLDIDGLPPGGTVSINNQRTGFAPFTLKHLQPGKYWVKVTMEGYDDYETIVDVPPTPGKVYYFLQRIVPKTATFNFTSKPTGAYVYIDDRLIGATPQKLEIDPGVHRLKIVMVGYPEYITDIVALKGETSSIEADLETLKQKFANFVSPKELTGAILLPKQDNVTFDVTLKNESTMPQAFNVKCPSNPSKGFEGMFIQTLGEQLSEYKTITVAAGEKVTVRFIAKLDTFAAPGDILKDKILISSTSLATWKTELPFTVEVGGFIPEPPTVKFDAPEKVNIGDTFEVKVKIEGAYDLAGCKFRFGYQESRVNIYDLAEGDFMNNGCQTIFGWKQSDVGEVTVYGPTRVCRSGVDRNGTILTLTFKAVKQGELILDFLNLELYDSKGDRIKTNQTNSAVIAIDTP